LFHDYTYIEVLSFASNRRRERGCLGVNLLWILKSVLEVVIKVAVEKALLVCVKQVKKAIEQARDKSR
ncbi:hypothetical protein, partial [Sharpea azabuensis]|uniref:hypothetical protein n=1 Tax=Sharpea azabuensis TaxID=322505 RepID=UPI002E820D24